MARPGVWQVSEPLSLHPCSPAWHTPPTHMSALCPLRCCSDTAHLSLLGYPPLRSAPHCPLRSTPSQLPRSHCVLIGLCVRYYRGRGAFESLGAGLDMKEGDIAFKVRSPQQPTSRAGRPTHSV